MKTPRLTPEQQTLLSTLYQTLNLSPSGDVAGRLIRILDTYLLDQEQNDWLDLNPWNRFFLLAAAGLAETGAKTGEPLSRIPGSTGEISDILSGILARVHDPDKDPDPVEHYLGEPVNLPFLSWVVRLALALDLSHPDTIGVMIQDLAEQDRLTQEAFIQSWTLESSGPHPSLPGLIRVKVRCTDPGAHRALKRHETRVQKLLYQANTRISPRFLYSDVVFEVMAQGYPPLDMKFSVDAMAALRLLTGNRLYSDQRVFLRELVQNAVDACRLRQIFDPGHTPRISICFDPASRTICFKDNGIGMDRQWIEKYFLKVGISFYQSGDLKSVHKSRMDCHFISKFGIGFLSSFLVAEKVGIRTRKAGSQALSITINTLEDYFDVRPARDFDEPGTEVTIFLKPEHAGFAKNMAYLCYLKNNLRFLSVPVHFTDHLGRESIIGSETFPYVPSDDFGRAFVVPLDFAGSQGYLFLKAKENQGSLYSLDYALGGVSIFQDGIFVTQTPDLLPEGARQHVIGRINLLGDERCELSMDRNRIFWTEGQHAAIKHKIRLAIVDLVNAVLAAAPDHEDQSLVNQLATFFDLNEINDTMYLRMDPRIRRQAAKRFRDFIRIHFAHTRNLRHVPDADGYTESWQQEILKRFTDRARPRVLGVNP